MVWGAGTIATGSTKFGTRSTRRLPARRCSTPSPSTLHPAPNTLHLSLTPYTRHPTPCTITSGTRSTRRLPANRCLHPLEARQVHILDVGLFSVYQRLVTASHCNGIATGRTAFETRSTGRFYVCGNDYRVHLLGGAKPPKPLWQVDATSSSASPSHLT